MMAAAFGPTYCLSGLVPESKLSHSPEIQYGFVPKLSPHGGENLALRAEKPIFAMRSFRKSFEEDKNRKNTTHDGCGLRPDVLFFQPCA